MFQIKHYHLVILLIHLPLLGCGQIGDLKEASDKAQDKVMGDDGSKKLSEEEIVNGLKEALEVGAKESVDFASKKDGFNKTPRIRIPFPPEAKKVKKKALQMGMDKKVKKFEKTMNRAAEKASKKATDIFVNAIKNMSVEEGRRILEGDTNAATEYLRKNTYDQLFKEFKPIVEKANDEVKLTRYWNPLAKAYNKSTMMTGEEKVNPDLDKYVTKKAIDGLFVLIAEEEAKIRKDPVARVTDILKKVFGDGKG
ncbi:MAG: DUF4197 domain-containing protein [Flavobacteriales bacterium]